MKLFILSIIKFSFLTILLYFITVCVLGFTKANFKGLNFSSSGVGRINLRTNDILKYDSLNILFLGSSHTFMSFDPRIFKKYNYNSFNFGSLAQSPIQTEYIYKRFANNIKTDLIVYEINPMIISNGGIESNIDLLNSIKIDLNLTKMSIQSYNLKTINTLVFRLIQDIFGYKLKAPELGTYIQGTGYAPTYRKNIQHNKAHIKHSIDINDRQILALKNLVSYWKKSDKEFLLVQAPMTKEYYSSINNITEIDSIFRSIGPYINYNFTDMNLIDSLDFADFHHFNQDGVKKFNSFIINDIKYYMRK